MHQEAGPRRYAFIDALRGIAILLVIMVHAQGVVGPTTAALQTLMAAGARGVQLFYIASAVTLCLSWQHRSAHEAAPLRNFYLRRLFRIVPMYYVAIALYVLLYGLAPRFFAPNGVEWYYIPLTALFVNGFHPETITSVVPGGWSIVVEMTFYLLFPWLVTRFRTLIGLLALIAVAVVVDRLTLRVFRAVYLPMYPADQAYLVDNFLFLNFFSQFPVFAIGMFAWAMSYRERLLRRWLWVANAAFLLWLVTWPALTGVETARVLSWHVSMGVGFALLALTLWRHQPRVLVNPLTVWVGRLSFSMYVIHFAMLDAFAAAGISGAFGQGNTAAVLHYLCVAAATAGVSWLSYRTIERPGIEAGRRLIARLEAADAPAPLPRVVRS